MEQKQARRIAEQIAKGHAYTKHVEKGSDFPEIKSRAEFAELIAEVMIDPSSRARPLREGRQAFWSERHRMIVILDFFSEDGGTAYRPDSGKDHFRLLR